MAYGVDIHVEILDGIGIVLPLVKPFASTLQVVAQGTQFISKLIGVFGFHLSFTIRKLVE